jgi:AraC family transcriptional regulator
MNKTIYNDPDNNAIRFSKVKKIEGEMPFSGVGIKYVAFGEEIYYANDKKYTVKAGEYIIGNEFTAAIVQVNQPEPAQGLCIDISNQIITEVADYHTLSSEDLSQFLLSDQFFVNKYKAKNTSLGYSINEINHKIIAGTIEDELLRNELFYSLAESIVTDQRFVFDHLNKLDFKKINTNEEVFRALLAAKEYIDEQLLEQLSLDKISSEIGISKYHFIRLFKNTFGISPFQYLKRKKLQLAKQELVLGKPIAEITFQLGFADTPTFTKAFKQEFGMSPGQMKKSNF